MNIYPPGDSPSPYSPPFPSQPLDTPSIAMPVHIDNQGTETVNGSLTGPIGVTGPDFFQVSSLNDQESHATG